MDSTGLAAMLAVTAGLFGAVQVAVMGKLGERIGSLEAVMVAAIVTGLLVLPVLVVARQGVGGLGETLSQPWWMLTGGALGAFIVLSITIAGPKIGTTAVVGLLIAGQLVAATLIDRYGWFGFDRVALDWSRVLGIVLLAAGAALTLRR
ncbi:MAG TPA: DMT family transporter [Gaiella sp.]|uniref:DMT family transporter n=1 Tax=Gaiella sp. TaxID=2663207 RepID=UPI002D80FE84|nr:DMT family transporter [Gaiella sp.]HET9285938.1 DMT family transporter [Gaiella sp.]